MEQNWIIPDKLCSLFGDTVRVEIGPQIIDMDCTDENLSNEVTHVNYRIGSRDADGRLIRPIEAASDQIHKNQICYQISVEEKRGLIPINKGEVMRCVDYREKHVPHQWKVYQLQEFGEPVMKDRVPVYDDDGNIVMRKKFIKVDEKPSLEAALKVAQGLGT